jgi:hypothetical protein
MFSDRRWRPFLTGILCAIAFVIGGALVWWKVHTGRSAADEALYDECLSNGRSPPLACDALLRVKHRLMDRMDALAREEPQHRYQNASPRLNVLPPRVEVEAVG